jgi:uncharacterized coiled-coil protein SlyX
MNRTTKLHFLYNIAYIAIILIAIIVCLLTVKWGAITELEKLLSFGLTLTSLFLSLTAIGFAIFSNFGLSKSSSSIELASAKISKTTEGLRTATLDIKDEITKIPALLDALGNRFKEGQQEVLEKISKQAEFLPSASPSARVPTKKDIENFLGVSSYNGLLALYMCKLSNESSKPFKFEDFKLDKDYDYAYGFLVACNAINFISYTYKDKIFNITEINKDISEKIHEILIERLNAIAEEHPEWPGYKEQELQKIESLEKHFAKN